MCLALVACGPTARDQGNGGDDDGGTLANGDGGPPVCQGNACSADLHSVVDCDGNTVQTCGDGLGCSGGACVDACQSAATNNSSVGCDYYAVNPDSYITTNGACFAVYVANTWSTPVSINVERGGITYATSGFTRVPTGSGQSITYAPLTNGMLMPNQVAILFLAQSTNGISSASKCPTGVTRRVHGDRCRRSTAPASARHSTSRPRHRSSRTTSFRTAAAPPPSRVRRCCCRPRCGTPTTSAVDAFELSQIAGQPFVEIVAQGGRDATSRFVRSRCRSSPAPASRARRPNANATYTLSKGQVIQMTQSDELDRAVRSRPTRRSACGAARAA